jgi:hypothetical protein
MVGDRYVYRRKPEGLLSTTDTAAAARPLTSEFYEAIVVDVIVDQHHDEYAKKDGYNVGAIKIRIFSVHNGRKDELLDWADPVESTILEMPLIGELVIVHKILGFFYYTRKAFIAHRIQENGMLKLNDELNNRGDRLKSKIALTKQEITAGNHKFGKYFKPDSRVRPLKHFEGDLLIQGRMGQSIRFGSSKMELNSPGMAPNIILRTGQGKDVEKTAASKDSVFGLILEDINKDASSIWMTADQNVPFKPILENAGSFHRSIQICPRTYNGAQIILNSDSMVLQSKKTHISLYSNEEIYLNSFNNTAIDTDSSIILTANIDIELKSSRSIDMGADSDVTIVSGKDISIAALGTLSLVGGKLHFGGIDNDVEPMVGGTSLSIFLARLIHALMGVGVTPPQVPTYQSLGSPMPTTVVPPLPPTGGPSAMAHVITPMGVGMLSPAVITALNALYMELMPVNTGAMKKLLFSGAPFNSLDAFVGMSNEDTTLIIEKNEFKSGKQIKTENNKWNLNDDYYKIS